MDECKPLVEGECTVKISGLGTKIEGIIVDSLVNAYKKLPEIVDEWLKAWLEHNDAIHDIADHRFVETLDIV